MRTDGFEAESVVEPQGRIVWLDAQAEARNTTLPSFGDQAEEESPSDSPSPVTIGDTDGDLRNRFVSESIAGLSSGEVSPPSSANRLVDLRKQAEIRLLGPGIDVVPDIRHVHQVGYRARTGTWPPVNCYGQRLGKKLSVAGGGRSQSDIGHVRSPWCCATTSSLEPSLLPGIVLGQEESKR